MKLLLAKTSLGYIDGEKAEILVITEMFNLLSLVTSNVKQRN